MENFKYIKVVKTELSTATVHTIQAPLDGELTNAQLIETPDTLILIDTLQLSTHAGEMKEYIDSLGKPLERVIVTHYHPDHWMGGATFKGYPIYALQEVIDRIAALADFLLGYHRNIHTENPDLIPSEKVLPTLPLAEGILEIGGVKLNLIKISETESPVNLLVELPDEKVVLAQDLVYDKVYAYFGDRTTDGDFPFDNWIAVLNDLKSKGYSLVIPGHGNPSSPAIFDVQIEYLEFAKKLVVEDGLKGEELIKAITDQYPDYQLELTLNMSSYMLFEWQE